MRLNKVHKILIRQLLSCLILLCQCKQPLENNATFKLKYTETMRMLQLEKSKVQSGDIITRTGNDFTSQTLRRMNRKDKTFSHCGIANIENDSLFIYHAIGGDYNPNQCIKRESFEKFSSPYDNNAIGIFRFDVNDSIKKKLVHNAQYLFTQKIKFDMDFDLHTDDKMYCAEYIYKCFLKANGDIKFNHSFINHFEFIGVDDIFNQPLCKKIYQLNNKLY